MTTAAASAASTRARSWLADQRRPCAAMPPARRSRSSGPGCSTAPVNARRWRGAPCRSARCACCSRSRDYLLPLAYVDNVADAIVLAPAQRRGARPRLHHRRRARAAGRLRAPLPPGPAVATGCRSMLPLGVAPRRRERRRAAGATGSAAARRSAGIRSIARCAARRSSRAAPTTSSAGAARSTRRGAAPQLRGARAAPNRRRRRHRSPA